jgi:hypothetical protein
MGCSRSRISDSNRGQSADARFPRPLCCSGERDSNRGLSVRRTNVALERGRLSRVRARRGGRAFWPEGPTARARMAVPHARSGARAQGSNSQRGTRANDPDRAISACRVASSLSGLSGEASRGSSGLELAMCRMRCEWSEGATRDRTTPAGRGAIALAMLVFIANLPAVLLDSCLPKVVCGT